LFRLCRLPRYQSGSTLLFVPGVPEVDMIFRAYQLYKLAGGLQDFFLMSFHGTMTRRELDNVQRRVAEDPSSSTLRYVIVATNIAESSLTLENLTLVVDLGLVKYPIYHEPTGCTMLPKSWADESMMVQRKGRVGRVCDGGVFRVMTREFFQNAVVITFLRK
jgi:HrpA-like RNA helicase